MSDKYKIFDNQSAYFITMTTVGWIDVFTRKNQKAEENGYYLYYSNIAHI